MNLPFQAGKRTKPLAALPFRQWLFVLLWLVCAGQAQAAAIVITANTLWSNITTGSGGGGRPTTADTITVRNNASLTINVNNAASGNIQLGANGSNGSLLMQNTNSRLTVSGVVTLGNLTGGSATGTLDMGNGGRLSLQQFAYVQGSFIPGSGSVTMSANNTLPNVPAFASFFNFGQSAGTTTLSRDISVTGVLTLTAGVIDSNGKTLTVSADCRSAVSRPANGGFVSGYLRLSFPSGNNTCLYPLGSATGYAPISVSILTTSSGGSLSAISAGAEHPQVASSGLDPTRDLNRHWSLWQSGDTIDAFSYGLDLGYNSGDADLQATPANFILARYNGASWSRPSGVTRGSNNFILTGQAGPLNSSISFAAGELQPVCNPPPDISSTMSCVCENFTRSNLNPSAIFGADWALSSSGGSFGLPRIVNVGSLRLTDNSATVATAATVPANFPAAGNLIVVEFKAYSYNGSGADGMALTLSDADIAPLPGAYGGSLGYAQKFGSDCTNPAGCAGFAGGWMGVALDEYGNFSNPTEGRVGGAGSRADAVAVRGSGSGASSASNNYPYLDGSASLSPGIDNAASTSPAYGHAYRVTVDARNYSPSNRSAIVSVHRDTTGNGNFSNANRLLNFDAYQRNPAQAAVPNNWKLSFTGSTGGQANIHEIAGLKICAQNLSPPRSFRIDVDNVNPTTCSSIPSGRPVITITALDINRNVDVNYNKSVTLKALLANGSLSSAVWAKSAANGNLVGNQYTFSTTDRGVARFVLTDSVQEDVVVGVLENGSPFGVTYDTPLKYRGGSFAIDNIDALAADSAGGVVAGRAHLFRITRSNACGVDTSYNGNKNLDGWFTPVAGVHPASALAPRWCAPKGGSCLPDVGSCTSLPNGPPALSAGSNNLPELNFVNGAAPVCLVSGDVGRYSLNVRDDSNISAPVAGASATVTARPFALVLSQVKQGLTNPNPASDANTSPLAPHNVTAPENAPYFIPAGSPFSATLGAYLWNAAADLNLDGLPDQTALLTELTAIGLTPSYADSIVLQASSAANSRVPLGGVTGNVSGNILIGASDGGRQTTHTLSYAEVGSFSLSAIPSSNYLASGVNLAGRVTVFANPSLNTRSAWVGRFRPHHFALTGSATLLNRSEIGAGSGCSPTSSFTYMGENIGLRFGLTAFAENGAITRNYAGNYARLNPVDWFGLGANRLGLAAFGANTAVPGGTCQTVFDTASPPRTSFKNCSSGVSAPADVLRAAGPRLALVAPPAAPVWLAGQASFIAEVLLQRADRADGPYSTLQFGIAPQDAEGVGMLGLNLDADQNGSLERVLLQSTELRYGRMRIDNAYGSELLPLPVSMTAQYWSNTGWRNASDDQCTPLLGSNFSLSGHAGSLTPANMHAGNLPANSGNLQNGKGLIRLSKPQPSVTGKGSVTLNSLLPYLPGAGRLGFGVFKAGPVIYIREIY